MDRPLMRIAVVGGGITGLAAAHRIISSGADADVTVFERSDRLGGKLWTDRAGNTVIERGADSYLAAKPWATALADELGIADRLQSTDQTHRGTFIMRNGELHPMPEGLSGLVPTRLLPVIQSSLLTWPEKLRFAAEPIIPARKNSGEESMASFMRRRFGNGVYDVLIDPLLSGIYAGRGDKLSLNATFPNLVRLEQEHGSLFRGALARKRTGTAARAGFLSFDSGLGCLIERLVEYLQRSGTGILMGQQIDAVTLHGETIRFGDDPFDRVIIATDATSAAGLLNTVAPAASVELSEIRLTSTVTVAMVFDLGDIPHPLHGHGYVIPRAEGRPCLAMTWMSSKWRGRTQDGKALIRVFIGRDGDEEWINAPDDSIIETALEEARRTLGITSVPEHTVITRWRSAMPQYHLGHAHRISRIEADVSRLPGIELAGNYLRGVGIPDCIREGQAAADRLLSARRG